MKKILNITSWLLFYFMVAAAMVATLSSVVGLCVLFIAICSPSLFVATLLNICAAGYFGSLSIMLMVYATLRLYRAIEKAVKAKQ